MMDDYASYDKIILNNIKYFVQGKDLLYIQARKKYIAPINTHCKIIEYDYVLCSCPKHVRHFIDLLKKVRGQRRSAYIVHGNLTVHLLYNT